MWPGATERCDAGLARAAGHDVDTLVGTRQLEGAAVVRLTCRWADNTMKVRVRRGDFRAFGYLSVTYKTGLSLKLLCSQVQFPFQ